MDKDRQNKDENEEVILEPLQMEDDADFDDSATITELQQKIKRLRHELTSCQKNKQEYLEGWQRSRAELVNSKRWMDADRDSRVQATLESVLVNLLPALDSFDHAFQDDQNWLKVDAAWRTGVERIHAQLISVLRSYDVEIIDPVGAHFDPNEHEPVLTTNATTEEKANTVVAVLQKGYRRKGKVLRPAKVSVAGSFEQ